MPFQPSESPSYEASLYRSDVVLSNMMIARHAQVFSDRIAFYKHASDTSEPEFSLTFNQTFTIGPVEEGQFDLKPPGTSRLVALVRQKMSSEPLCAFKVQREVSVAKSYGKRTQTITLGFRSLEEATAFREELSSKLEGISGVTCDAHPDDLEYMLVDRTASVASESPSSVYQRQSAAGERVDYSSVQPSATRLCAEKWQSMVHWNGLAVYKEKGPNAASMACCTIAASPLDVFAHMVVRKDGGCGWGFHGVRVLEQYPDDMHRLVFRAGLPEPTEGFLALAMSCGLLSRRDVVLEQVWSHASDGTFTIRFCSVEHAAAPYADPGALGFFTPVRAQVRHLGFTLSPLREDLLKGEPPRECLLTMLVEVNLGGAFHPASALAPVLRPLATMWLYGALRSLVKMRDELELGRFANPPSAIMGQAPMQPSVPLNERVLQRLQTWKLGRPVNTNSSNGLDADEDSCESNDSFNSVEPWLPKHFFSSPGGAGFQVRGANYLQDKKKIDAGEPAFALVGVEVCTTPEPDVDHISRFLPLVMHSVRKAFHVVVHFMMPFGGDNMHLVIVFAAALPGDSSDLECPFALALGRFVSGDSPEDDARRNATFKLIPKVADGPWVVKQAVGSTPCIVGNKLTTTYHRGPHYLEIAVNISSNSTAASITKFVAGYMSSLTILLGFVLEGKTSAELPEQLLGTVSLNHVDLGLAKPINTSSGLDLPEKSPSVSAAQDISSITLDQD